MIKLLILILIVSFSANASETQIICEIKKDLFNPKLSKRFSKIIDFKKRTVENLSGHSFDNLIIFNNYEIIMNNKIFDFQVTLIFQQKNGLFMIKTLLISMNVKKGVR